jgi:hypothetical protein
MFDFIPYVNKKNTYLILSIKLVELRLELCT